MSQGVDLNKFDLDYVEQFEKKNNVKFIDLDVEKALKALNVNPKALSKKILVQYIEAMEANYIALAKDIAGKTYTLWYTRQDTKKHLDKVAEINNIPVKQRTSEQRNQLSDSQRMIQENLKETQKQMIELDQQLYNYAYYERLILAFKDQILPWVTTDLT